MNAKRALGAVLLLALAIGLVLLVGRAGVRQRLARVLGLVAHDAFASTEADARHALPETTGIRRGDPVFLDANPDGLRPVAYVTAVEEEGVRLRVFPDASVPVDARLVRLAPPRGLADAYRMAVPPETKARLERELGDAVRGLLADAILPEIKRRLPSFLARVDPRSDEDARAVLDAIGESVLQRLRPLGDDLAERVASDVKGEYDLLERLGLLWGFLRGDAEGLRRRLAPVAAKSARAWWEEHREEVLTRMGEGIAAKLPDLQTWVMEDVLPAARDEIATPVLASQAPTIERTAERLIRRVSDAVIETPGGGFRLRFRTVLRTRLLEKDEPLLIFVGGGE